MMMTVSDVGVLGVTATYSGEKVEACLEVLADRYLDEIFLTKEELKEMIKLIEEEEERNAKRK